VELVGQSEDVGVSEFHGVGNVFLDVGAGVEDELDPALLALCSDVVLDGSTDLALSEESAVNKSVHNGFL
jgi:hypothetical protein